VTGRKSKRKKETEGMGRGVLRSGEAKEELLLEQAVDTRLVIVAILMRNDILGRSETKLGVYRRYKCCIGIPSYTSDTPHVQQFHGVRHGIKALSTDFAWPPPKSQADPEYLKPVNNVGPSDVIS
jgi:hypothetical protein